MMQQALASASPEEQSILFIEGVANLVCPAAFDRGETHKVIVLSVAKGEGSRSSIRTCSAPRI